jgi:glycosyltransferase involved in cell wall biosynthesis
MNANARDRNVRKYIPEAEMMPHVQMKQPPITVITVVFNAGDTVRTCVDSVLAQNISDLEYIVIDGGSTDGTLQILRDYGPRITRLISEPDQGLYDAMNKGLKLATGRFIHFLNADDRYVSPNVLSSLLPKLDAGAMCYGQMHYIEQDGSTRLLGQPFDWKRELRASRIPQPVMFAAPGLYAEVGGFDTSLKVAADYDMVLRLAKRFPVKYIAEPVTVMNSGGLSYRRPDLTFSESMKVSQRHGMGWMAARLTYALRISKWRLKQALPGSVSRMIGRVSSSR